MMIRYTIDHGYPRCYPDSSELAYRVACNLSLLERFSIAYTGERHCSRRDISLCPRPATEDS
jgi:hypothetical protein